MGFIVFVIGALVVYWIIRNAIFGAMRDFERWKRRRYGDPDDAAGNRGREVW